MQGLSSVLVLHVGFIVRISRCWSRMFSVPRGSVVGLRIVCVMFIGGGVLFLLMPVSGYMIYVSVEVLVRGVLKRNIG